MSSKKLLFTVVLLGTTLMFSTAVVSRSTQTTSGDTLEDADLRWDKGDYPAALKGYIALLRSSEGDTFVERIALQTGELFRTKEITGDGRAPRFSPDGGLFAYETGEAPAFVIRILRPDTLERLVELPGTGAVFSPTSQRIAYIKAVPHAELTQAVAAMKGAQGAARTRAQQTVVWLLTKHSKVGVYDLATKQEIELNTDNLLKSAVAFAADGRGVYVIGAREEDESRSDVYAVSEAAEPKLLTEAAGFKTTPLTVDPTGSVIIYSIAAQNPFRRPQTGGTDQGGPRPPDAAAAPEGTAPGAPGREQPAQAGGPGRPPTAFGLVRLQTGKTTVIPGAGPAISPDGRSLAFIGRSGTDYQLIVATLSADPLPTQPVRRGPDRLAAPTFSPDGVRVAFQVMQRDDWEIKLANAEGSNEVRVTREIQHDLQPRFMGSDRLLVTRGEPRHHRSFVYDLESMSSVRLFHNNSIRTIACEYAWAIHPDGSKVLVNADREGDTISPARGIYLVDLATKVTKSDLLARLEVNLAGELTLRENASRMFRPIAEAVSAVVSQVSTKRIFEYEKALFDFDSKHISQPGNRRASEYLFKTYQSFGYSPDLQWFEARAAREGKTANVIATLRGTENPELVYVISSHFDSVTAGPGADDDSSGTAALLEAARVLAGKPLPATVVFASFTGEEGGLLGSREWVRRSLQDKARVLANLNNDMIGWANDHRLDSTIRYSNRGVRDVQHSAATQFTNLITYDATWVRGTDAASFHEAFGDITGGFGAYPVLGNPHYHQPTDLLDTLNHQLIAEVSKTTAATVMLLASSPSRVTGLKVLGYAGKIAEVAWTPNPEKSVRAYVVTYGPPHAPFTQRLTVKDPRVAIKGVEAGTVVHVKAVNAKGLEGWDWARETIPSKSPTLTTQAGARRDPPPDR